MLEMKNPLKIVFVFVFLVFAVSLAASGGTNANSLPENGVTVESSRSLYRQHCAECHGANGKSQTPRGRETEADDLTTADVKGDSLAKIGRIISSGKGDMPGFKRKLSAAQIASIARYVKTL